MLIERREHRLVQARGDSEMSKVTCDMSMSVDGFVAGPNQSLANPFGEGVGDRLHRWMFEEPETNAAEIESVTAAVPTPARRAVSRTGTVSPARPCSARPR
jgi:hypothetical protein